MSQRQLLFDWGGTLMRTDPLQDGPMCTWPRVEALPGALALLRELAGAGVLCHLATGAADSNAAQIRRALARVGLDSYLGRIFCVGTVGCGKESEGFYRRCAAMLGRPPEALLMIGDSLAGDVLAARAAGLQAIWLHPAPPQSAVGNDAIGQLADLRQLEWVNRWLFGPGRRPW